MKKLVMIIGLWLTLLSPSVYSQSTGWLENPNHPPVSVRFMLTGELNPVTKKISAVLEVKLTQDWKTYWRSPGEGGIAPSINWENSTNVSDVDWFWPAPEQFSLLGMQTFGYQQYVVFPLQLTLNDVNAATQLKGKITLSSCTTVCVLTDYPINLTVNPNELIVDEHAMFIYNKAIAKVPQKVVSTDIAPAIALGWDKDKGLLEVILNDAKWQQPLLVIDGEPDTVFKQISISHKDDKDGNQQLIAYFEVFHWLNDPQLTGQSLNVTAVDETRALEYSAVAAEKTIVEGVNSIWMMLLFAVLGGLILNVMPCVLPVLGMKLSVIIAAPNLGRNQIRQQFLASAFGIFVSFWLLASFVMLLKLTGQAIGWGVQFQNPWFIGFMALVTLVFAFNMLGAFEINLPSTWQTKLATTGGNDNRGHFLQGMFATLLATPCSAPFLGTAVAFAFGAPILSLFMIFSALAFGMALPWLLVAAFPQVANYFPKPGRWMIIVKVFFSGLLLITSLWLISLLFNHIEAFYLWSVAALSLVSFMFLMARKYGTPAVIASTSIGILMLTVGAFITSTRWAQPLPEDHQWVLLNETLIAEQVAQGKTVFVDVTADWCITCKANKVGVILQEPVYSALKQANIITMKGDWTLPSPEISQYLQSFQRFGVPFNVVYGPNAPEGIELPIILSAEAVMAAIKQASVTDVNTQQDLK